jgi:glycosyltransferase involved in cell wall biosynthesis
MRVLHVTEAAASGTLEVVRVLSAGLVAERHEVAVAYGRRPETPAGLQATLPEDVAGFALPWDRRTLRAQIAAGAELRRIVARFRPDLVHLHSSFAGVVGTTVLRGGIPLVYTPHGSILGRAHASRLRRIAYRLAERHVGRRVDLVGAVSCSEAALLRRVVPPERVTAVANGIAELDEAATAPVRDGERPLVVALGRMVPARRPGETARILAAVVDVADVAWIGAAPPGHDEDVVRDAGVHVTGWLTRDEALEHLARATVLVHWSASDGASLAVLEAMAHDVVVVASDIAANRELVGEPGVRSDAAGAAALVRALLSDERLREDAIARQRLMCSEHSGRRMTRAWIELYATLLGDPTENELPESRETERIA